jgi:hypothetical protein
MVIKEIGMNTRSWVGSSQDRDYWRSLVNTALFSGFHKPHSYVIMQIITKNRYIVFLKLSLF